jgi:hypothetical protein
MRVLAVHSIRVGAERLNEELKLCYGGSRFTS